MLAAVGAGLHRDLAEAAKAMIGPQRRFEPAMPAEERKRRLACWKTALAAV
jgi:glycerol kinase